MSWQPIGPIDLIAGTPPGGGLDRAARALVRAIEAHGLINVPLRVVNVSGEGSGKAWDLVVERPGDPHVVAITSPNLATNYALGLSDLDHFSFTPLAILYTEYIAFVTRADSDIRNAHDLLRRLGAEAGSVTVALSTAAGNPNHIALAQITRDAGGDIKAPRVRVFDSALTALADVMEGNADVAAITAASASKEMISGRARAVAVSSPVRLSGPYTAVPTWSELSVDCTLGAWRGISGARELAPEHVACWESVLSRAVTTDEWNAELARYFWTPMYLDGARLRDYLDVETTQMSALLAELGLAQRGPRTRITCPR